MSKRKKTQPPKRKNAEDLLSAGSLLRSMATQQGGKMAIESLTQALQIYDEAAAIFEQLHDPVHYAYAQMNKANAMLDLAQRIPNAEFTAIVKMALACYNIALGICTIPTMATDHARIQQNKGIALRQLAERSDATEAFPLLEQAIGCFDIALTVRNRKQMPLEHARTQVNKGNALQTLAQHSSLEQAKMYQQHAITCYTIAADIFWQIGTMTEYADANLNTGNAFVSLVEQSTDEDVGAMIKQAASCFDSALEIFKQTKMPVYYADALIGKGNVLLARAEECIKDDKSHQSQQESAMLLKESIACYDAAQPIYGEATMQFAFIQQNKGKALLELAQLHNPEETNIWLEQAITCFDSATKIYERVNWPLRYANVQIGKGKSLRHLAERSKDMHIPVLLEQAIICYTNALPLLENFKDLRGYALNMQQKGNMLRELATWKDKKDRLHLFEQALTCYEQAQHIFLNTESIGDYADAQLNRSFTLLSIAELYSGIQTTIFLKQALVYLDQASKCYAEDSTDSHCGDVCSGRGLLLRELANQCNGPEATELLKQALVCYDRALRIHKYNNKALILSSTHTNKGATLVMLAGQSQGNDELNLLRQAITEFDAALVSAGKMPVPEAIANKGVALTHLAKVSSREQAIDLLERALLCFDESLKFDQHNELSDNYAFTQRSKGVALDLLAAWREQEEAKQLMEQALTCFTLALQAYDRVGKVADRAASQLSKSVTQMRLASEYLERNEAVVLLQEALIGCDQVLTFYNRADTPHQYAVAQLNKGSALLLIAQTSEQEIAALGQAIICLDNATELLDSENYPFHFAGIQRSKGEAFRLLGIRQNNRIPLLEQAIQCYETALEFYPFMLFPHEHRSVAQILCLAYWEYAILQGQPPSSLAFEKAQQAATSGLRAAQQLEQLALSPEFRQSEWVKNEELYTLAGVLNALRDKADEAVLLLESGRARGIAEAQRRRQMNVDMLSTSERTAYEKAVNAILALEARGRYTGDFHYSAALVHEAEEVYAHFNKILEQIQQSHQTFLLEPTFTVQMLASGLLNGDVLTYLIPTIYGTLLLLLNDKGLLRTEWFEELTTDQISKLIQSTAYSGYLPALFGIGSVSLEEALDILLPELGKRLVRRIIVIAHEMNAKHAILLPGGSLALIPLHAASYEPLQADAPPTAPNNQRYACDDLFMTYAPSGRSYLVTTQSTQRTTVVQRGFVVGNPKLTPQHETHWDSSDANYLLYAQEEATEVANIMHEADITVDCKIGAEATWSAVVEGLQHCDIAHLAMHAIFNPLDPLTSAFLVAPQAKLFLRDMLDPRLLSLEHLRLAVLSACQSGIGDFLVATEEATGLFGALLAGGVLGVIGSLWPVHDYSTKLLMIAFTNYYLLLGQEPSTALYHAIHWLRNLSNEDIVTHSLSKQDEALISPPSARSYQEEWQISSPTVRQVKNGSAENTNNNVTIQHTPLEHPIHWAAFVYYGN
jgi:CHAT domain-containing protein/tetratricopeptide (TPR) repeat protein